MEILSFKRIFNVAFLLLVLSRNQYEIAVKIIMLSSFVTQMDYGVYFKVILAPNILYTYFTLVFTLYCRKEIASNVYDLFFVFNKFSDINCRINVMGGKRVL